jgi:predicted ATPase
MATAPTTQVNEADELTKPPFLRRLRIRGYKSITFCDVRLHPLTILVGRNAAGKSNFLDALAFLRDTMAFGVAEAVKRRGGWSSVASRTANTHLIEIELEAGFICGRPVRRGWVDEGGDTGETLPNLKGHRFSARYALQIEGRGSALPVIRREILDLTDESDNQTGGFDLQRITMPPSPASTKQNGPDGIPLGASGNFLTWNGGTGWSAALTDASQALSPQRSDLCLLSVIGLQPYLELSEGLRFMGFYNFLPDAIRGYQKPNPGWLLEKDGRNLASVIEGLKEIDPESMQRVRDYLSTIAEDVESFDVVRYGELETVRFRLRSGQDGNGLQFDAASMSDGTLRALASLMAAFQIRLPFGPSVIGIEEPETALHPAAMRALVDALDDATQHTQILLTTHSADLLSGRDVSPGQVLIVRSRDRQTYLTPIDPASREIIQNELYSLADLQRMDKLDLDEADLKRQAQLSRQGGT